ncbi:cilia- and flagella-associated protein 100 isoform X2 [Sparus aurata]|uniref:cilia- and flagella-associated protein 100 isoform X2 n=1 Tax=Sparus aurata TaxID=8175 RepID=UPI0011C19BBF|nr:cilia- and flagella-associated protein 100-like isoform X2 [Sparus aurata]
MPEVTLEMSSPQHRPEIPSGSVVVSEADGDAKSHKPGTASVQQDRSVKDKRWRKETPQSPFKVPESNNIFLQSISEKEDQKEETRKFLALPIDKKTAHTARMMAKLKKALVEQGEEEEEEEEDKEQEKVKSLKQVKSGKVVQTPARRELKMAMMKRENIMKDSKQDLISMERQKAVLELSLMTKRSEILRMDKCIAKEEEKLKTLEKIIERDNLKFEEFLRENEKKSVEARTLFEREAKSKQNKNAEIKKLTAEIWTVQSELTKFEETLMDSKRYKELLFKLSPPEWQEAQKLKALKANGLSPKEDSSIEESSIRNGLDNEVSSPVKELPSIRETSATSNTKSTNPNPDSDSSEYEDEPELYFTDPQQLLDQVTELTEQNLSLIQASARAEGTLVEMRQLLETARKKIEKDEEQLKLQINDMNERVDKEKKRGAKLKQKVQLHVSLNTEDQDLMLEALGEKVAAVHRCCVDDRMTNISTLEKLTNIEKRMSVLLQDLESIPEDSLEMMKKIKDSERRSREREKKLREQQEKQKERTKRYTERSLADSRKITGRKLMPRCMPVAQKVKVSNVDDDPAEDEIHASLYSTEDME